MVEDCEELRPELVEDYDTCVVYNKSWVSFFEVLLPSVEAAMSPRPSEGNLSGEIDLRTRIRVPVK